jgi:hypothetical protein
MGPNVKPIGNAATPAATDFVSFLQGLMDAGSLGTGVGPLQQGAGDAITNFVNTGVSRIASGGVDPGTDALIGALTERSAVSTNRQAGDLREAFGAAGNRFGSGLANAEALLRGEASGNLSTTIGDILTQRQGQNEQNVLQGIGLQAGIGQSSLAPFLALLAQGLPQAENVVSPGLGSQLLTGLLNAGAAFAGRGTS